MKHHPSVPRLREQFGRRLNEMMAELLPAQADFEVVHSPHDLRQDAMVLLFQRYLDCNRLLQKAVRRDDVLQTQHELTRSVVGAITVAHKRRMEKNPPMVKFEEKFHGQAMTAADDSAHQADARWRSRTEHLLRLAEERHLLSPMEIPIVRKLVVEELSRSVVGNACGLNPVELTRLLQRCSRVLARLAHERGWRETKPFGSPKTKTTKRLQP